MQKANQFVFVGIHGSVVALRRDTGEQAWATHLKGSDFVNVVVQQGAVLATTYGEIFCLDAATGTSLWHNKLKGLGTGLATIAVEDDLRAGLATVLAEKSRRDQAAAQAAAS
jgi:outer membrane protein assembly factor BamB